MKRIPARFQFLELDPLRLCEPLAQLVPGSSLLSIQVECLDMQRPRAGEHQLPRQLERILGECGPILRIRAQVALIGIDVNNLAAAAIRRVKTQRLGLRVKEEEQQTAQWEKPHVLDRSDLGEVELAQEVELAVVPARPLKIGRKVGCTSETGACPPFGHQLGAGQAEAWTDEPLNVS